MEAHLLDISYPPILNIHHHHQSNWSHTLVVPICLPNLSSQIIKQKFNLKMYLRPLFRIDISLFHILFVVVCLMAVWWVSISPSHHPKLQRRKLVCKQFTHSSHLVFIVRLLYVYCTKLKMIDLMILSFKENLVSRLWIRFNC